MSEVGCRRLDVGCDGAEDGGETGALRDADRVDEAAPGFLADAVGERFGDLAGDVLHQRAAEGDVQHLESAADGEHRQVAVDGRAVEMPKTMKRMLPHTDTAARATVPR